MCCLIVAVAHETSEGLVEELPDDEIMVDLRDQVRDDHHDEVLILVQILDEVREDLMDEPLMVGHLDEVDDEIIIVLI